METFEEKRDYICNRAKELKACSEEYKKALKSETLDELIEVVRFNASWCRENDFLTDEKSIEIFSLSLANLFNSGDSNSGNSNSGNSNSGNRNSGNSNSGNSNSGNRNSGDSNSGNWNSGYRNSGDRNSGDRNSGNWNSGNSNSGDSNSGYRNSGDSNSGNRNSGDSNSGNWNSGDSNSGNWNSGNSNSGDSNSGYRNDGAFCNDLNPKIRLFNMESEMTVREWEIHPARNLMYNLDLTVFVQSEIMTEEEKKQNTKHETVGGYLKTISYKEAWANFWGNLSESDKKHFTTLPNFDSDVFEDITGIKVK